jgi:hypothetical protein
VFNCLNQFLLNVVLSIEERIFLVEYFFLEGNRYTSLGTYGALARRIFLNQTFICGRQQNLQFILIAHVRLMN